MIQKIGWALNSLPLVVKYHLPHRQNMWIAVCPPKYLGVGVERGCASQQRHHEWASKTEIELGKARMTVATIDDEKIPMGKGVLVNVVLTCAVDDRLIIMLRARASNV
jgi:hypothetical protein